MPCRWRNLSPRGYLVESLCDAGCLGGIESIRKPYLMPSSWSYSDRAVDFAAAGPAGAQFGRQPRPPTGPSAARRTVSLVAWILYTNRSHRGGAWRAVHVLKLCPAHHSVRVVMRRTVRRVSAVPSAAREHLHTSATGVVALPNVLKSVGDLGHLLTLDRCEDWQGIAALAKDAARRLKTWPVLSTLTSRESGATVCRTSARQRPTSE